MGDNKLNILKRMFTRGVYGATSDKEYKVERAVTKDGNSLKVSIPPVTVEDLGLQEGVWLEKKGKKLIITKKGE